MFFRFYRLAIHSLMVGIFDLACELLLPLVAPMDEGTICTCVLLPPCPSLTSSPSSQTKCEYVNQGVAKRCRLSWLTHSALVYDPNSGGRGGVAASAGVYTATLLLMVNVMKGGGRAPPPSPAWTNFTLMMECTPESSRCYSVYSTLWVKGSTQGA